MINRYLSFLKTASIISSSQRRAFNVSKAVFNINKDEQQQVEYCKNFLRELSRDKVPKMLYSLKYSRSSGPGGQNVNKLSTKVTLSLNQEFCRKYLPRLISDQLVKKNFKFFNKFKDAIVVQSDLTRSRESNVDDCFRKLFAEMQSVVYFRNTENDAENDARWKKIKKATNEKRLNDKKKGKQKKESRKKIYFD